MHASTLRITRPFRKKMVGCFSLQTSRELKPFEDIPGPKALPGIGNLWRYFIGEYSFERLYQTGLKKYEQFGPLVREEILPGVNLLHLFSPEDIQHMYQIEGQYPSRRSHTALEFYRMSKPEVYNTGGLLPTNGPEWYRLRMSLQRPISSPQNVRWYINQIDGISEEFVRHIEDGQTSHSPDFLEELSKVFLEFVGLVTLDSRLGSLKPHLKPDSCPMKLIKAANDTNSQILATDNGLQIWRHGFKTPAYRKICQSQEYFEEIASKCVREKQSEIQNRNAADSRTEAKTLLEIYLMSAELDSKDVVAMVSDMLLAGIDTSAFTMSFILYHLAKNPSKQAALHDEIRRLAPRPQSALDWQLLARFTYLKAVVKETFRLNPISIGVGRILPEDGAFSGYFVPKNTVIVTQNQVSCQLESYFHQASRFLPERWIRGHPEYRIVHPYLVLPFGHGPRSCIARRLAEQNIYILLMRLVQRFHIEWTGDGDLDCVSQLINRPSRALKFTFTPRA
nr:CYP302A1 protein [Diaphanosoma celebensis]